MIDRKFIGHTFAPYETVIEAGRLRLFCKAIGETNALHFDKAVAIQAGYRNVLAPLTFPTAISFDNPNPRCVYELLDVKIGWVLHGEEAYEFGAPICVGDTITASWKITDIYNKKGGAMEFIAVAVDMTNQLDEVVCVAKRLLIVRQPQ